MIVSSSYSYQILISWLKLDVLCMYSNQSEYPCSGDWGKSHIWLEETWWKKTQAQFTKIINVKLKYVTSAYCYSHLKNWTFYYLHLTTWSWWVEGDHVFYPLTINSAQYIYSLWCDERTSSIHCKSSEKIIFQHYVVQMICNFWHNAIIRLVLRWKLHACIINSFVWVI